MYKRNVNSFFSEARPRKCPYQVLVFSHVILYLQQSVVVLNYKHFTTERLNIFFSEFSEASD